MADCRLGLAGWLVGVEGECGSDVACRVGVGEGLSDFVGGLPPGAVAGDDEVWGEGYQFLDCVGEDGLEEAAGEVESTNEPVNVVHSGDLANVVQNVDHTGVAAAG